MFVPRRIVDYVARFGFDESSESFPIVKQGDVGVRALVAQHGENGGEQAAGSSGGGLNGEVVQLPLVRGDTMLLGAGSGNHGFPIGATTSRHHGAGVPGG